MRTAGPEVRGSDPKSGTLWASRLPLSSKGAKAFEKVVDALGLEPRTR
jgi:hypothetical protein